MRFLSILFFCIFFCYINSYVFVFPSPSPLLTHGQQKEENLEKMNSSKKLILDNIFSSTYFCIKLLLFTLFVFAVSTWLLMQPITFVKYIEFSTNLSCQHKPVPKPTHFPLILFYFIFIISIEESMIDAISSNVHYALPLSASFFFKVLNRCRSLRLVFNHCLPCVLYLFSLCVQFQLMYTIQNNLKASTVINFFFQSLSFCCPSRYSIWVTFIQIYLSNDVETNPGDFTNNFFSFCNWNINSLAKNNFQRVELINAHNSLYLYDLISLCEVSLNDSVEVPDGILDGYNFIAKNNAANTRHGGVGLFYKNSLPLKVRDDLSFNECIVVELNFGRKKIFFSVLYRSPSIKYGTQKFDEFLNDVRDLYLNIKNENPYSVFFTGDFNGHNQLWWPGGDSTPEGNSIEELTSLLGLTQLVNEPTNFEPNKAPSCIDLIFTDQPNLVMESGTRNSLDPFCHHQITYCRFNYKIPNPPSFERKIWIYDRADINLIRTTISRFPWEEYFRDNHNVNWQVDFFTETILNIMSNFIPNKIIKIIPSDPPWIDKNLKTMLNKQKRLYRNYKRHGFRTDDKVRVDSFRDECSAAILQAKSDYLKKLGNEIADPRTSQKSYWKIINRVLNKCKAPKIPPLLVNNIFVTNAKEKAEVFLNFFSEQCKPIENDSVLPNFAFLTNERLTQIPIVEHDILTLIRNINKNKSSGSDGISARMLSICDNSIVLPLKLIFANILNTGTYPDKWKKANVTPIHKKGSKQLAKNYRPISLLPICSKLFERIIFKYLYSFLISNDLITKNQSGFRPGDSTINQLLDLTNDIHKSFDHKNSLEVRAVFLDISKAFDKVWHEGLIFKLKQNGISGNVLSLLQNYLSGRKQRVILNGSSSPDSNICSGVPQGSVLGPLLFLIYINDLEVDIKSKVKFFADDTMLFSIVNDPLQSASDLNHDLELINKWAYQWKMAFNPEPSKQAIEVLFSHKTNSVVHPPLFFNGSLVSKSDTHKHLGILFDSKLSFSYHIVEKIKKAKKIVFILRFLSQSLPLDTLNQMYKMFVRPHLDYGDIIFHIPHTYDPYDSTVSLNYMMEKIENIQYQAALAISGCWQGTSRNKIYDFLGWESLSDRRWARRLIYLYKVRNNLTPQYLKNILPTTCHNSRRNDKEFREIICHTLRYKNSFFPDAVKSWNNVSADFRNSNSLVIFKNKIFSLIRPSPKSFFGIHDPAGLKLLFQLRVGLSQLKYHKKRHNFADTTNDTCECTLGTEDTSHFLFHCPFHSTPREILIQTVSNILNRNNLHHLIYHADTYLFGNHVLNLIENKSILSATIAFIKESERFLNPH